MDDARYFAITAAHNEESFLPGLIGSMVTQTCAPRRWIIINDGSSDRTGEIIDSAAKRYSWIVPYHLPSRDRRGVGGELVMMRYIDRAAWDGCDFMLRVDADITFGSEMVERLLAEFARNPRLGIAAPRLYEQKRGRWQVVDGPAFHCPGAVRLYSRSCFEAIGGLEGELGWDTIDLARAMMRGFTTQSFAHVRAFHHRPMGSASGRWRGRIRMGEAAYNAGYSPLFMLVRSLRHCFKAPWMMGGILMMMGYVQAYVKRRRPLADKEVIRFIRTEQWRRLTFSKSLWR